MKKLRAVSIAGSVIATCLFAALPGLAQSRPSAALESSWIKGTYRKGDFKLVYGGRAANILVSPDDFKVARIAAADLAGDIERVTGLKPAVRTEASTSTE